MLMSDQEDADQPLKDHRHGSNDWILKYFVPEKMTIKAATIENKDPVCGEQIGSFYESVVQSSSNNDAEINATDRLTNSEKKCVSEIRTLKVKPKEAYHEFFRCAENGDVERLRHHIDGSGLSVNTKDDYGWTALMCAACRGKKEAVDYLLDRNADRKVKDGLGKSALLLANENGHSDVVKRLLMYSNRSESTVISEECGSSSSSSQSSRGFDCETCRLHFVDESYKAHVSSTIHQFNERKAKSSQPATYYHIPESNVGYKIMLKDGWNRERGLGSTGSGIKFPPKTVLKRNKRGFGAEKLRARITHFGPGDVAAVQRASRSSTSSCSKSRYKLEKIARSRKDEKQRRMEVNLRRQFNELE